MAIDPKDPVVAHESGAGMRLWGRRGETEQRQRKRFEAAALRRSEELEAHNKAVRGRAVTDDDASGRGRALKAKSRVCAQCQKREAKGEPKFNRCGACRGPTYCSKACQRKHWKAGPSHPPLVNFTPLSPPLSATRSTHTCTY